MSNRTHSGFLARIVRRTAILTGAAATSLALLAGPAAAAPPPAPPGTCAAYVNDRGEEGVGIFFPTVPQLAPGTVYQITVIASASGGAAANHGVYRYDGSSPYWQFQLPYEIFGGEWRTGTWPVNTPGQVAGFVKGYRTAVTAVFKREYLQKDASGNLVVTGLESDLPVQGANGGGCYT